MTTAASPSASHFHASTAADALDALRHTIEHVAHLLPSQGPIAVFVHHNTLHPFESMPFEDAVKYGAETYHCQPYLSEERYRQAIASGRIRLADLDHLLREQLQAGADRVVGPHTSRFDLRLTMLQYPLVTAPDVELRWSMAESDALRRFREDAPQDVRRKMIDDTRRWILRDLARDTDHESDRRYAGIRQMVDGLIDHLGRRSLNQWTDATWERMTLELSWQLARRGVHALPEGNVASADPRPLRQMLFQLTGEDADNLVHEVLIRFCAAFLDQGLATWHLPQRDQGFFAAFDAIFGNSLGPLDRWLGGLQQELAEIAREKLTPLEVIQRSLTDLGIRHEDYEPFLAETLLSLRGWAGMIWQMETAAEWTVRPAPRGTLHEFLAVHLLLDRLALRHLANSHDGYRGPLSQLRQHLQSQLPAKPHGQRINLRAFYIFQLAQLRGWSPEQLHLLTKLQWQELVAEIEAFSPVDRRSVLHRAFELRYTQNALGAIASHAPRRPRAGDKPRFQLITCIDDREESFRRHLEEVDPQCETFGAAGFFSIPMYYRGLADAHYVPLCPNVIKPQHYVQEDVAYTFASEHVRRAKTRRAIGSLSHQFHLGSRTFLAGAFAAIIGSLASVPLVARVLFPRLTSRIRRTVGQFIQPPRLTQLDLERLEGDPSPDEGHRGFTLQEMASMIERLLRDIGLTHNFANLVIVTGHGSSSLNNPHESAYNCGACGGGRGGPNARAVAAMANDPRVRRILQNQGLDLPPEMVFVGAYHNTCDDSVTFFDLDRLPVSHRRVFEAARGAIDQARQRNAHERCRRFESAPLTLSREAALRHVEERSEDLSQARPEYNHATCAMCFVGRRDRTRGLFLDRRCFLTSYDPTQDDAEATILGRILGAVIPVCSGISLEYYFSCVDPVGWGCGSKLPHNITSLLGVMEGAASDLRTGLSAQMVEIHEPLRILFVIESTPEAMLKIMARNQTIDQLTRNRWIQLAVLDPQSSQIQVFEHDQFREYQAKHDPLPVVSQSEDWYRGWRDHLGFAECTASLASGAEAAVSVRRAAETSHR